MKTPKTLLARTLKSFARTEPKKIVKRKRRMGAELVAAMEETLAAEIKNQKKRAGRPRKLPPRPVSLFHSLAEDHPSAVLKNKERKQIIRRYDRGGVTQEELAKEFGVTQSAISHVVRNQRWLVEGRA